MEQRDIEIDARMASYELLLALLIAKTRGIDLTDTQSLPAALVTLTSHGVLPGDLGDHARVGMRDTAKRVLDLAKVMRMNVPGF